MARTYLKDPREIYRQSFETVRREVDLSGLAGDEADLVLRLVHACGMPEIAPDIRISTGAVGRAVTALAGGAPILCDCTMVAAGISLAEGALNPVLCMLDDPEVPARAKQEQTTRSAAQVPLWREHQEGAVIAIGNAPTALFRLLEEVDAGAPMPAIVLGFPVGFVGAAESKQDLADTRPTVPHATLLGRRGGSAMAAAAVNALARMADGRGPI